MDSILVLPESDTSSTIFAVSKHETSVEPSIASVIDRLFARRKQEREERIAHIVSALHESGEITLQVIEQLLTSERYLEYYQGDVKVSMKYYRIQDEVQDCRIKVRGS